MYFVNDKDEIQMHIEFVNNVISKNAKDEFPKHHIFNPKYNNYIFVDYFLSWPEDMKRFTEYVRRIGETLYYANSLTHRELVVCVEVDDTCNNIKSIPHPMGFTRPDLSWLYLENIKGTKRLKSMNVIRPLYFVPMAKPQNRDDMINDVILKPFSAHLNMNIRDANEKKISPRSTYTVMDSFTIIGMERKATAPRRPYTALIRRLR